MTHQNQLFDIRSHPAVKGAAHCRETSERTAAASRLENIRVASLVVDKFDSQVELAARTWGILTADLYDYINHGTTIPESILQRIAFIEKDMNSIIIDQDEIATATQVTQISITSMPEVAKGRFSRLPFQQQISEILRLLASPGAGDLFVASPAPLPSHSKAAAETLGVSVTHARRLLICAHLETLYPGLAARFNSVYAMNEAVNWPHSRIESVLDSPAGEALIAEEKGMQPRQKGKQASIENTEVANAMAEPPTPSPTTEASDDALAMLFASASATQKVEILRVLTLTGNTDSSMDSEVNIQVRKQLINVITTSVDAMKNHELLSLCDYIAYDIGINQGRQRQAERTTRRVAG